MIYGITYIVSNCASKTPGQFFLLYVVLYETIYDQHNYSGITFNYRPIHFKCKIEKDCNFNFGRIYFVLFNYMNILNVKSLRQYYFSFLASA